MSITLDAANKRLPLVFYEPDHKQQYAADVIEFITNRARETQTGKATDSSDGQSKL